MLSIVHRAARPRKGVRGTLALKIDKYGNRQPMDSLNRFIPTLLLPILFGLGAMSCGAQDPDSDAFGNNGAAIE